VKENVTLRDKLTTLKEYFVTTESEQQANRDRMIDSVKQQSNVTRFTGDIDVLTQVRTSHLSATKLHS